MRRGAIAVAALCAVTAACSSREEPSAPPVTADEQRAVADAQAMIPANEQLSAAPDTAATEGRPR